MQFGYDMRPSFWQEVRSNSHLVIAAVGTAALLGVAAVALWLALPANERQAVANPEQAIPAVPVKTTKIAPAGITVAAAAVPQAARKVRPGLADRGCLGSRHSGARSERSALDRFPIEDRTGCFRAVGEQGRADA
ncbi:hypothetical protein [Mesorhizobium sp. ORM16]|uniref:hypothetical protein n=1 Tax=Mesorhizobium sp. ORM16 TaxID=3376989 RepID=UPI00385718A0